MYMASKETPHTWQNCNDVANTGIRRSAPNVMRGQVNGQVVYHFGESAVTNGVYGVYGVYGGKTSVKPHSCRDASMQFHTVTVLQAVHVSFAGGCLRWRWTGKPR